MAQKNKKIMLAVAEIAENGEDVTLEQIVYFDFPAFPAAEEEAEEEKEENHEEKKNDGDPGRGISGNSLAHHRRNAASGVGVATGCREHPVDRHPGRDGRGAQGDVRQKNSEVGTGCP